MKKLILFAMFLAVFFSVAPGHTELKDKAIVQAVGIDWSNGKYLLSVLYYSPSSGGGENTAQTDASASKYIFSAADNLEKAFAEISMKTGKVNYYGHNDIIVLGREAVKNRSESIMSYINSTPALLSDIDLLAADNTAKEILTAKTNSNTLPSKAISKVVKTAGDSGTIPPDRCIRILDCYLSENTDVLIPRISLNREQNGKYSYTLSGAEVLNNKSYSGDLSAKETLGYNMLKDIGCKFSIDVANGGKKITATVYSSAAKIRGGRIEVRCKCRINNIAPVIKSVSQAQREEISLEAQNIIKNEYIGAFYSAGEKIGMYSQNLDKSADVSVNIDTSSAIKIGT